MSRGLIDPYKAKPYDARWQQFALLAINQVDSQLDREALQAKIWHNRALFPHTDRQVRGQLWDALYEDYKKERKLIQPWITFIEPAQERKTAAKSMEAAWIEQFGDPDSPETKAAIARTVARLQT